MMPGLQSPPIPDDDADAVQFHFEDVSFPLDSPPLLIRWIKAVLEEEKASLHTLTFIFCSDEYLLELNLQYLNHDTLTDIITFPYLNPPDVEGDIFISADRIRENADAFGVSFERELHRVMIHGVLHLCGYSDKTAAKKKEMTAREDAALALLDMYAA